MANPQPLPYGTSIGKGPNATAWAEKILADLGAPQTPANINTLIDWMDMEGGGGANNPLNTTIPSPGVTKIINSAGVESFDTPADGIAATVKTIKQPIFSGIYAALKSGKGFIGSTDPSIRSELLSWSGNGYSTIAGSSSDTATGNTAPDSGGGSSANTTGLLQNIFNFPADITGFFKDAKTFIDALLWIVNPASWLRIGSFFIGVLLIIAAIYVFLKVGSDQSLLPQKVPVPVPV
jgi:hypothetical protein